MDRSVVAMFAAQYDLDVAQVAEEVAFVLGDDAASLEKVRPVDMDRLYSYFSSMYSTRLSPGREADTRQTVDRITVQNWRQISEVDIDLTSNLTIITGENGTGKTTLLGLIALAFGEGPQLLGTPIRDDTGLRFRSGGRPRPTGDFEQIGTMGFSSGLSSRLGVREWEGPSSPTFSPELIPHRDLRGIYLDAQRAIGPYQRLESIPARFADARELAQAYRQQLRNIWIPHQLVKTPGLLLKEALVAAAMYGEGNAAVKGDPIAKSVWDGFQEILVKLFPPSLEFEQLHVDQGELILSTKSGPFAVESASGGLSAIISLSWQIYLSSRSAGDPFTVCFDEPENHLHPSLQRTLLPSLVSAFPDVKFIVATHSPFVVTSIPDARVHALRRNDQGRVISQVVDLKSQAYSATEVLNEVLGVDVTLPVWAENRLNSILQNYGSPRNPGDVSRLLQEIRAAGIRVTLPEVTEAVSSLIEANDTKS